MDEYKTVVITFFITTIGGWIASTFSKTLKKINDSEDTRAKLDEHIKNYCEDMKDIKEDIREVREMVSRRFTT